MATKTPTLRPAPDRTHLRVSWENFTVSGDVGTSVGMASYRDRSVQVLGDFTGGLEITIEGSNDGGTTWATLTDPQGNSLVITAAKIEAITEVCGLIRPRASAGAGSGDADVWMHFAGNEK